MKNTSPTESTENSGSLPGKLPALPPEALGPALKHAIEEQLKTQGDEAPAAGSPESDEQLVEESRLQPAQLMAIYAEISGLPQLEEEDCRNLQVYPQTTYDFLHANRCLPVSWDDNAILLAVSSPYETWKLSTQWQAFFHQSPLFVLARSSFIERQLTAIYDRQDETLTSGDSEEALKDLAREAPIVRLVNDMFSHALESGASDIHIEPQENSMVIRFRVDGMLKTALQPPKSQFAAIASRIKLLAGMNIAERRLPQDGRIDLAGTNPIDVRVSTVPCMHGESIVLRLLQKDSAVFDLDKVGLLPDTRQILQTLFQMPHGMILVVGPTGSGKTTTLYCIMSVLNAEYRKIITIEDPVEYQLEGLTQIQVKSQIGLTFANGLRAIVRQDPDVILVGEIRDRETAEIAIHAALTGHLVLSTLHTNDAAGAITRLDEMGVEPFLISSSLLGVVSQRLVRRICPECGGTGIQKETPGKRCRHCSGSGYRGRVAIFELMQIQEELRRAINARKDSTELTAIARTAGMRTLREDGEKKVQLGLTTQEEVSRVCMLDTEGMEA